MKSKFSHCSSCVLQDQKMVVGETNSPRRLSDTRILILAEAPAQEELVQGKPLVGKSGQVFRKVFSESKLNEIPHVISNVVLCSNIQDGKTVNPPIEAVESCKPNWNKLIEILNPEIILVMGSTSMQALDITGSITKNRGKVFDYKNSKVFVTFHPSYIMRNGGLTSDKGKVFKEDFEKVYKLLNPEENSKVEKKVSEPYCFKFDDWILKDEHMLVDIQNLRDIGKILHVFSDEHGNMKYNTTTDDGFYYYTRNDSPGDAPVLSPIEDAVLNIGEEVPLYSTKALYESDVSIERKHAIDYYTQRVIPETKSEINTMYFDIEVYSNGEKSFPDPKIAARPINAISFRTNKEEKVNVWVARLPNMDDNKDIKYDSKNMNLRVFSSEAALLKDFCQVIKKSGTFLLAGWNCIEENENIWLSNRIEKIKDLQPWDHLRQHGKLKHKEYTGMKEGYELEFINGTSIVSSKDHIYPIYIKKKESYKYPSSLEKTEMELSVEEIYNLMEDNDIYCRQERSKNKNCDYTWKEFLVDNIKVLLNYELIDIDIIIDDPNILRNIDDFKWDEEYYKGDRSLIVNRFRHDLCSKRLGIDIDVVIKYINNNDIISISFGNRLLDNFEINKPIDRDSIEILGFQYTDGFWARGKCDINSHIFSNKENDIYKYYDSIIENKYRKIGRSGHKQRSKDGCYYFSFGFTSEYTLLMPFIYNKYRNKELNLTSLSKLSFSQFSSFCTGLIDGDGSSDSSSVSICNFENEGLDIETLAELFKWNGIYCNRTQYNLHIPYNLINENLFLSLKINHPQRKNILNEKMISSKGSPSKSLNKFHMDDYSLVKLNNIKKTNTNYKMYDIETDSNYFICNGIKTHNCIGFDIVYIYNRMKKQGINTDLLSPIGYTRINPNKYGDVVIGGIYVLDMLEMYKTLSESVQESYALGAIAKKHLGDDKVGYQGSLDDIYENDIETFIRYSYQDTNLLVGLNDKLGHIALKDELRRVCSSTWKSSETTSGILDPLMISFAKKKGLICRNANPPKTNNSIPGAYVRTPKSGLHTWLVDLDYASLYPSIACSLNIGPNTYIGKIDKQVAIDFIYNKEKLPEEINIIFEPMKSSSTDKNISLDDFNKFISDNNAIVSVAGTIFKGHDKEYSFFYEIFRYLLDSRKAYKKQMNELKRKGDDDWKRYHNIQWAYKIAANSLYGVLAEKHFRMFELDLAQSITLTGQELVKFAGHHVNKYMETNSIEIDDSFLDSDFDSKQLKYLTYCDTDSGFFQLGDYVIDKGLVSIRDDGEWVLNS